MHGTRLTFWLLNLLRVLFGIDLTFRSREFKLKKVKSVELPSFSFSTFQDHIVLQFENILHAFTDAYTSVFTMSQTGE